MNEFFAFLVEGGPIVRWLALFVIVGLSFTVFRGFFLARKIQPKGFRLRVFRNEILYGVLNVATAGTALGWITGQLTDRGVIAMRSGPVEWWVVALEYGLYFFLFDTYFYWFHRLMHKDPIYRWVHKIHHFSTSPNPMTTISVSPFESIVNGGFVPIFLSLFTVHEASMAWIGPTNILMGFYVHMGFEFFPRWWNRSWLTKWFITSTFHDQHHKYFLVNFGGYTTIWDRLCGTMRPTFEADFDAVKARAQAGPVGTTAPKAEAA